MHTSCSSTLSLFPLIYALFAQTAFLPAPITIGNETILGLPIVNVSRTSPAASVAPVPVSSRNIVLAFTARGQPIPEAEVKDTLVYADLEIENLARQHSTQPIVNDRFECRRPNGNMLISIAANVGEEITWSELKRILQGLYRYMAGGIGTEETHYIALAFEIEAGGQEKPNIGLGLVWYFPPTEKEVQKRVRLPLPISLIDEGNLRPLNSTFLESSSETLRPLPNATLALPGANNVQKTKHFPIPRTSLSLSFYFFGPSIPAQSVKATLQGATAKVRPFLNGPFEMDPIENGSFRWVLPLSREAGVPVAVTVFTYPRHEITWRQLFDVLFGLYAFATTFGTDLEDTHYQVLGFRIVDFSARNLGVGTISYFKYGTDQLAKRWSTIDNDILLQPPGTPNISSFNPVAVSKPIAYPVAKTDITLTFTFLGIIPIPPLEIKSALSGAQQQIAIEVASHPDKSIPGAFRDISTSDRVSTSIFVYPGKTLTWKELNYILTGILQFCQDDQEHDRVLVFEIDLKAASRGRVGFGNMLYVESDPINVDQRALAANDTTLQPPNNTIVSQPSLTTLAARIPYPIPGTLITLTFSAFGPPISSIYVNAAFTSALRGIQNHVIHHPNTPIPNDRWERRGAVSRVWITVVAYNGNKISWQDLSSVLSAVLRFMTGAGEHRCREVGFFIDKIGQEGTGYGSVTMFPEDDVLVNTGQ